jgi:hypothetical protein
MTIFFQKSSLFGTQYVNLLNEYIIHSVLRLSNYKYDMAILKNILVFLLGSTESDFPVYGKKSKMILSDANMTEQLLVAIDKEKHGESTTTITGKKGSFKIERVSEMYMAS